MEQFHRKTKTIKEIYAEFSDEKLIIDDSYQRRSVWMPQDKVRFIETILLDLVVPEVFFWPAAVDAETGDTVTHIVDGQQRIRAIVEFIDGEYPLTSKWLLDEIIKSRCGDSFFTDLSSSDKQNIWIYNIPVVSIKPSFKRRDITQMFYRLNLTNYSLNAQEKRNSQESEFGKAALSLSQLKFWESCKVFSFSDGKRMKDVEFCCSIYILANEGVVDQTKSNKINEYYDTYAENFDESHELQGRIEAAMELIASLKDKTTTAFVAKKAQMYTMFSFVFKLQEQKIELSKEVYNRFKLFVRTYNHFRNEYNIQFSSDDLRETNELIKKYKLASSEGINKLKNRMIRLETLCEICLNSHQNIEDTLSELEEIYKKQHGTALEVEGNDSDAWDNI